MWDGVNGGRGSEAETGPGRGDGAAGAGVSASFVLQLRLLQIQEVFALSTRTLTTVDQTLLYPDSKLQSSGDPYQESGQTHVYASFPDSERCVADT